jgi:hypothetical protein
MKIEFQAIKGAAEESFTVMLCEDDQDPEEGADLGTVRRINAGEWSFTSSHLIANEPGEPIEPWTLNATTIDELRSRFKQRFSAIELPANRVTNNTMDGYARATLENLRELASGTNSTAGYLAALAEAVAAVMVNEFGEDMKTTLKLFELQMHKCIDERIAHDKARKEAAEKLGALLGLITKVTGADSEPTKH